MAYDNYFGKYTMHQYPAAAKRKYASRKTYRDFIIAAYHHPTEAVFDIDGLKVHEIYFVIDDMGDNVLPVDVPFGSPFECIQAIDVYHRMKEYGKTKTAWSHINMLRTSARYLGEIVGSMLAIKAEIEAFEPDPDFGDDPKEFKKRITGKITSLVTGIPGQWKLVEEEN